MLLVSLAVVQVILLAFLVILFTQRRKDTQNSVPEILAGLADLHTSAVRLESKVETRAFLLLLYSISAMGKPGGGVVGCDLGQSVRNSCFQTFHRARLGRAELLFDL